MPSRRLKDLIEGTVDHHASQRWPALEEVTIRWRGSYGYLTGYLSQDDDDTIELCRIQYLGDPDEWAFAIWQASTDSYAGSVLLDGRPAGHPNLALDTACTLYLAGTSDYPVQPDKPLKDLRGAALVHARTLLVTIPEPAEVLAEMVRLARPGGWVASQEPDAEHAICYPALPAWTRLHELFQTSFGRNGADLLIGRRLAELYRGAGLRDVQVQVRAPRLSGRAHPPHRAGRPGAQPAPDDRRAGPSRRAGAHRGGPGGPGAPRRPAHRGGAAPVVHRLGPQASRVIRVGG